MGWCTRPTTRSSRATSPSRCCSKARRGREPLLREARALARLTHPHVVAVYDVVDDGTFVALAMELVEGEPLSARHAAPLRERHRLLLEAARGLDAIHQAGMVHRDIKPANVLVGRDGRARVGDLGLAHVVSSASVSSPSAGTRAYMAPEQAAGGEVTVASDVYAFCLTAAELLSGRRRQAHDSPGQLALSGRPKPQAALSAVLMRGLSENPQQRPSMQEVIAALERAATGQARRRRALAVALVLSLATAAAVTARASSPPSCPPAQELAQGLWPADERERLRASLARRGPQAAPQVNKVLSRLRSQIEQWSGEHHAACLAARAAGAGPIDSLRLACTGRDEESLRTVLSVLSAASPEVVAKVDENTDFLLSGDGSCRDDAQLLRLRPEELVPAKATRGREFRGRLVHVRALALVGRNEDALAEARRVERDARSEGLPAFVSEALFFAADAEARVDDLEAAARDFHGSFLTALQAGHDSRAVLSAMRLVRLWARNRARAQQVSEVAQVMRATWVRAGRPARLEYWVLLAEWELAYADRRFEDMVAVARQRVELAHRSPGTDSWEAVRAEAELASSVVAAGDLEQGTQLLLAAVQHGREVLAREDARQLWYLAVLSDYLVAAERRDEARQLLEEGLALAATQAGAEGTAPRLQRRLATLLPASQRTVALQLVNEAVAWFERHQAPADLAEALLARARVLAAGGLRQAALLDCARAAPLLAEAGDPSGATERELLGCRARALEGRAALTAWKKALEVTPPAAWAVTRGRLALEAAHAAAAVGDGNLATHLAEQAGAELAGCSTCVAGRQEAGALLAGP